MKESITVIGVQHDNEEREITFEYEDNVIEAYWAPAYAGQPRRDRFLFGIDWEGNFEDAVRRMLELWGNPETFRVMSAQQTLNCLE